MAAGSRRGATSRYSVLLPARYNRSRGGETASWENELVDLEGLKRLSRKIGRDPTLVQGAGGNTSIKDHARLYVKASGFWLKDACDRAMFTCVDRDRLSRAIGEGADDIDLDSCVIDAKGAPLKPSIETTMHAALPHRVVVHTHSVNAIAVAIRRDAKAVVGETLAGLKWAWVPYARPGMPLTRRIHAVLAGEPDVLVLGNHGVVIGAEDCAAAEALVFEVERRLSVPLRVAPPADAAGLRLVAEGTLYRPFESGAGHGIATDLDALRIATRGSLYPDHVVFLGPAVAVVDEGMALAEWLAARRRRGLEDPAIVLVAGRGLLARDDLSKGGEAMVHCLALVLLRTQPSAPINFLTAEDERELLGWDAETYRMSVPH